MLAAAYIARDKSYILYLTKLKEKNFMSHFAVAVFSDGNKTLEELMAPYQENNMNDCQKSI